VYVVVLVLVLVLVLVCVLVCVLVLVLVGSEPKRGDASSLPQARSEDRTSGMPSERINVPK
jgi:preprotein translocase subunit SecG